MAKNFAKNVTDITKFVLQKNKKIILIFSMKGGKQKMQETFDEENFEENEKNEEEDEKVDEEN